MAKGRRGKGSVFRGKKSKTAAGQRQSDLMRNRAGRIVSRKQSAAGKASYAKNIKLQAWLEGCVRARSALGIKGFVALKKGTALYAKAKELCTQ